MQWCRLAAGACHGAGGWIFQGRGHARRECGSCVPARRGMVRLSTWDASPSCGLVADVCEVVDWSADVCEVVDW
eukprot:361759-Chlamydomonas_euryale.AAC.2